MSIENLHEKMEKSLDMLQTLDFFLKDLNVKINKVEDDIEEDKEMEINRRLKSNNKIIKTFVPPCKTVNTNEDVYKIPVPGEDEVAPSVTSAVISAHDAIKLAEKAKSNNIEKAAGNLITKIDTEIRKDVTSNPYQVQFSYELPVAGIATTEMIQPITVRIYDALMAAGYKEVHLKYTDKFIPTIFVRLSLV